MAHLLSVSCLHAMECPSVKGLGVRPFPAITAGLGLSTHNRIHTYRINHKDRTSVRVLLSSVAQVVTLKQ